VGKAVDYWNHAVILPRNVCSVWIHCNGRLGNRTSLDRESLMDKKQDDKPSVLMKDDGEVFVICPNCGSDQLFIDNLKLAHCNECGWDELDGTDVDE